MLFQLAPFFKPPPPGIPCQSINSSTFAVLIGFVVVAVEFAGTPADPSLADAVAAAKAPAAAETKKEKKVALGAPVPAFCFCSVCSCG